MTCRFLLAALVAVAAAPAVRAADAPPAPKSTARAVDRLQLDCHCHHRQP